MDAPRSDAAPLPALGAGRYVLSDRLGSGGMASVWLAYDDRLGAWRAAKLLLPELAVRPKLRERFENEARTLAKLEHANIVRVYDVGADEGVPWLVMELLQGGSPNDWVEAGRALPPRHAVDVVLAVCAALAVAHDRGVVHRDVKPSNILFSTDGTPKVTDFGIARAQDGRRGLTRAGTSMGTLAFMAPEQQKDATSVDHRADIFAVGATLFNLATAKASFKLPFAEADPRVLHGLPPLLHPVVTRACRLERSERYPDVRALAADLEALVPHLPPLPPDLPPLYRTEPLPRGAAPAAADASPSLDTDPSAPTTEARWAVPRSIVPPPSHSSSPPPTPHPVLRSSMPVSDRTPPPAALATPPPAPAPVSRTPAPVSRTPAAVSRTPAGAPRTPGAADPAASPVSRAPALRPPSPSLGSPGPRSATPAPAARWATPAPGRPDGTPSGVPAGSKTLSVELPRRARLTVEFPCEARRHIAHDPLAATPAIHRFLQEQPAFAAASSAARRAGTPPETTQIRLGGAEPVPWSTLNARYERLERHAHLCYGCPARVQEREWGCVVELPVPIPGALEVRLVDRAQTGGSLGGHLLTETLDGDRIKGEVGARMRQQGLLALPASPTKLHSKWLFLSRYITGDELVEALLAPPSGANQPLTLLGLLIGLGALAIDGVPPVRLQRSHFAELAVLKTTDARRELTELVLTPEDPPLLEAVLRAMRSAWIHQAPLGAFSTLTARTPLRI